MKKLVIANWKMNPKTEEESVQLAKGTDLEGAVIAPPYLFLSAVGDVLKNAVLGAQDVFYAHDGAHTGEVSVEELKSLGVQYVILGHSERRALGETDKEVARKVRAVIDGGLRAVLCVGELREVRDTGLDAAREFVGKQLAASLPDTKSYELTAESLLVAYEPVWAISTNRSGAAETPEDAAEMITFLKETLQLHLGNNGDDVRVLYGGSVNAENAESFLSREEIDGALVGGASLGPDAFREIVRITKELSL